MKKHDEGYALVFVLVVMTVLSIVAITLMSAALNNLQSQTASVERMEDKYVAQGIVEVAELAIVEQLEQLTITETFLNESTIKNELQPDIDAAIRASEDAILEQITDSAMTEKEPLFALVLDEAGWKYNEATGHYSRLLCLNVTYGEATVECRIRLENIIKCSTDPAIQGSNKWNFAHEYTKKYEEYVLSYGGGGAE